MPSGIISDWEINIWRRFKLGESAASISKSLLSRNDGLKGYGDSGKSTVLKIVLLVESQMATSKFYQIEYDAEGTPDAISVAVQPPAELDELEVWLRSP